MIGLEKLIDCLICGLCDIDDVPWNVGFHLNLLAYAANWLIGHFGEIVELFAVLAILDFVALNLEMLGFAALNPTYGNGIVGT